MIERFEDSDGLGAIFPPMVWSVVALRCLGYDDDSPELRYCYDKLAGLELRDEQRDTLRLQPCLSPVWDTAIATRAMLASGACPESPQVGRAAQWLLDRQILAPGDWSDSSPSPPGGWCFEFANRFYPDVDDTAMVLMALCERLIAQPTSNDPAAAASSARRQSPQAPPSDAEMKRLIEAIYRGERWILAMQNRDGGWGAFDKDNDRQFLCAVPFADHNAMIDPSTPDLTARVLEALGILGRRAGDPTIDRAIVYLRQSQESDGSWYGRWGVNYVYGTWQAIAGLRSVGVAADDPMVAGAVRWLLAAQQTCGGWGESADSYEDPALRGQGPVTASQTAWALLGLLAAGMREHAAVQRGVEYLQSTQRPDGGWDETEFTGTGFPRVFYLRYHLYPIYFPLLAMAQYMSGEPAAAPGDHAGV